MLQMIIRLWNHTHPHDPLDIKPHEITARALRAGGAMAILIPRVDKMTAQLYGHWQSDTCIQYFHIFAAPIVHIFTRQMFGGGHYTF